MKIFKTFLLVFGVLAALTTPAFSIDYYLRADVTTLTVPDANGNPINIPMWGFALENSTFTAGTTATVPGPMITVPSGDTTLTIHLKNNLTAANLGLSMGCPVSLVIPGQIAPMTPVRFGPAPYPQYEGRIRSLTHETPPDNSTVVDYVWNNVQPGSYVYHSGTHVQCHVQMGLYGGVIKDYALAPYKQVYQNIVYDVNVPLFFSEIDPVFHMTVDANMYGPGKAMSSTIDYEPKYFLINGQVFDSNNPVLPIPAGASGGGTLLRLFNMGLQSRSVLLQGSYMSLVAEDGQPYKYPKEQYAVLLPAGKTIDAMVSFPAAGTYPVYDRKLGLVNDRLTGGGMLRYLSVAAGNMWPVITSVTATPASITDSQTSQLLVIAVDTDGPSALTYSWDIPVIAGSLDSTTIANPVFTPAFIAGTQIYTFTVTVSDGSHVDIGTVDVTVTGVPNAAPIINSVTATPASILDTQTSQLQVNATDDGLPSPPAALSYNWIVPAGAGSVSNAAIANPVYTPPDVLTQQLYTLTVEVSDGAVTVNGTVDVNVSDTAVVPVEVIVDNLYAGNTQTGTWLTSSATGFWATNSVATNTAGSTFTFNTDLVPGTTYAVYGWWTYLSNRVTNAPYEILDGATLLDTVVVNQRLNTSQWVLLGTYTFNNGPASIKVSIPAGAPANSSTNADAVQFVPVTTPSVPVEVIVDNLDAGNSQTGTWLTSSATGFWATNSVATNTAGSTFTFNTNLVPGTTYAVYGWWTYLSNRVTNAPYEIRDGATLLDTVIVNQQLNTSQWVLLGTYTFNNGPASIKVSVPAGAPANSSTNADAVQFVPVTAPPSVPVEVIVDNLNAGNSQTGTWLTSSATGFWATNSVGTNTAGSTFTFNTDLVPGTTYVVYGWWTYLSNRVTNAPYEIRDGATLLDTVVVNQRLNTSQWVLLGTYTFNNGPASIKVSVPAGAPANSSTNADAIRFVPAP